MLYEVITAVVKGAPYLGDPSVHHVRRRHHIRTGFGVGKRGPGQKVQGGVIVDMPLVHKAAMPVVRILAEADISYNFV